MNWMSWKMKSKKQDDKLILELNIAEYTELFNQFESVDRVMYQPYVEQGFENLILDFPIGNVIAVLTDNK